MSTVKEIVSDLSGKMDKQKILLAQLAMWDEVQQQGIDPETVESFGFDPALLSPAERREATQECRKRGIPTSVYNPFGWPTMSVDGKKVIQGLKHNYVRLKTGEKIRLVKLIDRPPQIAE